MTLEQLVVAQALHYAEALAKAAALCRQARQPDLGEAIDGLAKAYGLTRPQPALRPAAPMPAARPEAQATPPLSGRFYGPPKRPRRTVDAALPERILVVLEQAGADGASVNRVSQALDWNAQTVELLLRRLQEQGRVCSVRAPWGQKGRRWTTAGAAVVPMAPARTGSGG
jgi:hypothetical protein